MNDYFIERLLRKIINLLAILLIILLIIVFYRGISNNPTMKDEYERGDYPPSETEMIH